MGSIFVSLTISGCTSNDNDDVSANDSVTISAAASLTASFTTLAQQFQDEHPDIDIKINFGGSGALAQQIAAGAPVDLFASASAATMNQISQLVESPQTFARNELIVISPAANPGQVSDYRSIGTVSTVMCVESAPCGIAAEQFIAEAGITAKIVSLEPDVKSVLNKVISDEVDAGVVYVTDAKAAGDRVISFPIPAEFNVITEYQIAPVRDSVNKKASDEFLQFVLGSAGTLVLESEGFMAP